MSTEVKSISELSDLIQDESNANQGTDRGQWALRESLIRFGVGRGVLADKNGKLIGGNKTHQAIAALGDDVEIITVPATGRTLVVTQRVDLDLDEDPEAREMAYADNRVSELNLSWDAAQIVEDAENIDIAAFFHQDELNAQLAALAAMNQQDEATGEESDELDPTPEMEILPFEHYDYVLILFRNTWDWAQAVDIFNLEKRAFTFTSSKGQKHRKAGMCRVISGKKFLSILEEHSCKSSSQAVGE